MALTDNKKDWVEYVAGKQIDATSMANEKTRNDSKNAFLENVVNGQINDARQEIEDAQTLIVTRTKDANILVSAWRKMTKSTAESTSDMKWRADDSDTNKGILTNYELRADVEIDTNADIDENTKLIKNEDIGKLMQSFERIKELEKAMKLQFDDNGEPLFSDTDIRNELWTPLVRSGLIPDNMVPDAYSEQAIAFKGAQDLYAGKLEDYTATHNKEAEKWKRGLRIAKATATVIGSVVSNSFTINNATDVADRNQDINDKKQANVDLKKDQAGLDKSSQEYKDLQVKIDNNDDLISTNKEQIQILNNQAKNVDLATTLATGGLSMGEVIVDHVNSDADQDAWTKWAATIEKGISLAQSMSVKSAEMGMRNNSDSGGWNESNVISGVTCAMNAAFSGAKIIPKMVLAVKEPDASKRAAMITGMISDLASVVQNSMGAAASNVDYGDTDAQKAATKAERAQLNQIAAYLGLAIKECGNVPAIVAAYKKGDYKAIGMLFGGTACAIAFAASTDKIFNEIHSEMSLEDQLKESQFDKQYVQVSGGSMEMYEDKAITANLNKIASSMQAINMATFKSIEPPSGVKAPDKTAEELQAEITGKIEESENDKAKEQLKALLTTPEGAQAIMDDAEAVVVGFEKMYQDAYPDTGITTRESEVIQRANEAIDRAMANTSALRQKVALINGISGGAAGVLAALVPGTGAVVAVQKVLADIYALTKCVDVHNAWVDSMEVALAGQSGSSAAIQNILVNAKIHLSQASIKLVLDGLKAGAEVAKMFDPTGAAAITSASASMASAVVDYGYQMQKEAAIIAGWNAYKKARANPKNRKAARKALRLNTTLAKCCIAYGASIMGDTAAKQAIKATGLSIAAMQDDKDICKRLISYLENELTDDPEVLMVDYQKGVKWMPGTPSLNLVSWTSFKAACNKTAQPALALDSVQTPAIDRLLALLAGSSAWADTEKFATAKEQLAKDQEAALTNSPQHVPAPISQTGRDMRDEIKKSIDYLDRLNGAFGAYRPMQEGDGGKVHDEMEPVAKTFATIARASKKVAEGNLAVLVKYPGMVV